MLISLMEFSFVAFCPRKFPKHFILFVLCIFLQMNYGKSFAMLFVFCIRVIVFYTAQQNIDGYAYIQSFQKKASHVLHLHQVELEMNQRKGRFIVLFVY